MAEKSLATKLLLKPGQRVAVVNAPEGYVKGLGPLPDGVHVSEAPEGSYDLVQLFVQSKADADRYAQAAIAATKPGGILWVSYPKKSGAIKTDISRDNGWEAFFATGWRPVTQIALDETWSALRFRPTEDVKGSRPWPPAAHTP